MKIQTRLLLILLFTTTFAMVIALLATSYLSRNDLEKAAQRNLTAILETRVHALNDWEDALEAEMYILSKTPAVVRFLGELSAEFDRLDGNAQTLLQQNYLVKSRDNRIMQIPPSITAYDKINSIAMPFFLERHDAYGWGDIFLIDVKGNVVFSLKKAADFATNLLTGPWRDSGLALAVMPLLHDAMPKQLSFADYSLYAPDKMQAASFYCHTDIR